MTDLNLELKDPSLIVDQTYTFPECSSEIAPEEAPAFHDILQEPLAYTHAEGLHVHWLEVPSSFENMDCNLASSSASLATLGIAEAFA